MTVTSGTNISLENFLHDGYVSYIKALPKFVNFCPAKMDIKDGATTNMQSEVNNGEKTPHNRLNTF